MDTITNCFINLKYCTYNISLISTFNFYRRKALLNISLEQISDVNISFVSCCPSKICKLFNLENLTILPGAGYKRTEESFYCVLMGQTVFLELPQLSEWAAADVTHWNEKCYTVINVNECSL